MKNGRYYLLTLLLSLSLTTICQETSLRNRISINAFSYKFVNKNLDYIYPENSLNFLNGVAYNRKFKHLVTRFSLNFIWDKEEVSSSGGDTHYGNEYLYICSFNTGIQKEFDINKFNVFFGLDLYYNLLVHRIDFKGGITGEGYSDRLYDNWMGVSPFFGIRYNISNRFSISIETSYNIQYNIYTTRAKNDPFNINYLNYFNPVNSIYLGYSF